MLTTSSIAMQWGDGARIRDGSTRRRLPVPCEARRDFSEKYLRWCMLLLREAIFLRRFQLIFRGANGLGRDEL